MRPSVKIGFLRFHGQDSAYVYVGSVLHAVQQAYGNAELDMQGLSTLVAQGELSYREMDYNDGTPPSVLDVGDML